MKRKFLTTKQIAKILGIFPDRVRTDVMRGVLQQKQVVPHCPMCGLKVQCQIPIKEAEEYIKHTKTIAGRGKGKKDVSYVIPFEEEVAKALGTVIEREKILRATSNARHREDQ